MSRCVIYITCQDTTSSALLSTQEGDTFLRCNIWACCWQVCHCSVKWLTKVNTCRISSLHKLKHSLTFSFARYADSVCTRCLVAWSTLHVKTRQVAHCYLPKKETLFSVATSGRVAGKCATVLSNDWQKVNTCRISSLHKLKHSLTFSFARYADSVCTRCLVAWSTLHVKTRQVAHCYLPKKETLFSVATSGRVAGKCATVLSNDWQKVNTCRISSLHKLKHSLTFSFARYADSVCRSCLVGNNK